MSRGNKYIIKELNETEIKIGLTDSDILTFHCEYQPINFEEALALGLHLSLKSLCGINDRLIVVRLPRHLWENGFDYYNNGFKRYLAIYESRLNKIK